MDKQKKQAIGQMILAAVMCAAVAIPDLVQINVASAKEQAANAEKAAQIKKAIEYQIAAVHADAAEPEQEPVVLAYYDNIPLDKELQNYIIKQAHANGIQPQIIMSMIERESDYDTACMGDNGQSYGLMQIMKKWHTERMGELGCTDLLDPYQNVTVGIDYLCELLSRYDGDMAKALTAYNRGHYSGTVTTYAKAVLEKADEIGGANVYELYR